jgi:glutamate racemase
MSYTVASDSISAIDLQILDLKINDETTRELGPLKYVSTLIDKPMDSIINWFMLLIIFVFDPLAISLVIVANIAFGRTSQEIPTPKEVIVEELDYKKAEEPTPLKTPSQPDPILSSLVGLLATQHTMNEHIYAQKINEIKKNLYGEKEIK